MVSRMVWHLQVSPHSQYCDIPLSPLYQCPDLSCSHRAVSLTSHTTSPPFAINISAAVMLYHSQDITLPHAMIDGWIVKDWCMESLVVYL
jgi:hypothetical protein